MALWILQRIENSPQTGPLALVCAEGETALRAELKDTTTGVVEAITFCAPVGAESANLLTMLDDAGYTPNDFGLG